MSALANLKLSNVKRSNGLPTIQIRRHKLIEKLGEQIQLAQAQQQGQSFNTTRLKTIKDEQGQRQTIEVQRRVKQWWWVSDTGKTCLNIRYGARALELVKGKSTVEVGAAEHLVDTLKLVKNAVELGELDTQIEAVSGAVRRGFKK